MYIFFLQAEDGIRDIGVTGVQTCALPISPHRERATAYLFSLDGLPVEPASDVAWTQYGLFRREVFAAGVRFDTNAPFDGAGWGFEDNDLAFQLEVKGFANQRFSGMTYLHRNVHSS